MVIKRSGYLCEKGQRVIVDVLTECMSMANVIVRVAGVGSPWETMIVLMDGDTRMGGSLEGWTGYLK